METHGKVDFFAKPNDDGVNVLVPAFHPWQASHPEADVYLLVVTIRYLFNDHIGIEVDVYLLVAIEVICLT